MKKTVVGVIGAGGMGRVHIENIMTAIPRARLKRVSDPAPETYNKLAKEMGWPEAEADHAAMIRDPEVEAVVIAAPAALHGDMIIQAAKAGKHIFCEKPLDYSVAKILEALKAVEKAGVKLQLGFNRRFDRHFAKARKLLDEGRLGDVHIVKISSRDPVPPAMGYFTAPGGEHCSIYTDTTIHDFDMARFLNPSEVVEVYAMGSKLVNKDKPEITRDDTCAIVMRHADASLTVIDNSWEAVYGYDQRAEVFGTKGTATVENDVFSRTVLHSRDGIVHEKPLVTIKDRYGEAYAEELRQFIDAIQKGTDVPVTGMDGLLAIVIANAARKSAEEDRPVKIAELMPEM